MQVRMAINGYSTTATLEDNASARDFLSMLPMTLKLDDYNATEKIAYLPRKLTTTGAPAGIDPEVGDITYYAPWGNLAIFYRDFGYSTGLIRLGRFDGGVDLLKARGGLEITIEAVAP
ncbi:cyclophilin-like fold protein [Uliginosibacterium gangwonense]|uniref:cyclophilin-like fold protein n=1 Tax=Uliginosibacterium gangwonense TaxID=392736 RepID=UPI00037B0D53|nr:cyclophilin-like fold protein [Uliginosibacterium gangwonense]